MSAINLTRTEAADRAALLEVHHYDIELDFTATGSHFPSRTTIEVSARYDGETFLELRDAKVLSVHVDGEDVTEFGCGGDKELYDDTRGLKLALSKGKHTVVVDAQCQYTNTGQGIHRFVDPADNETYLYTQFETADAKRVFACFDQPDLKARYSMTITAPEHWTVVSNSHAVDVDDAASAEGTEAAGAAGAADGSEATNNGAKVHRFRVDVPLSTYLVAFCAGPWHEVHDSWSGTITRHPETPESHVLEFTDENYGLTIPLGIYCRKSLAEYLDDQQLFTETKEGFDFYAKYFGEPYPFKKYDQIFCPEYNFGAMENAGCVTIRDEYIFRSQATGYLYERRNDTLLHEMAHMWFGDLVTMKWWDDLWLNESFATWSAAVAQAEVSQYPHSWTTFTNVEKAWAYQQDQLPSTHPIAADATDVETVEQNFDGITYAKGASVLKQLAAYVGQEAFLAGTRLHFARHRFSNATFADLLGALSEASGRDLSDWADQWLTTTGINTLSADYELADDGTYSSFTVKQLGATPGAGERRTHRIAIGVYAFATGKYERLKRVELDIPAEDDTTEVAELVGAKAGDVVIVNDDDLTYGFAPLDERSLAHAVDHIDGFTDSMPRSLVWTAAWQMTRSATMRARDYVALVLRGANAEDIASVLERVVAQAVSAVSLYADPQWAKDTGYSQLGTGLIELARAEKDAGRQLIYVNGLCQLPARHSGTREVLEAIFGDRADTVGLDEITVDTDMKWRALTALVAAGFADEEQIAAMQAEDESAAGQQAAIQARAAIPSLANKKRVWEESTTSGEAQPSNLALRNLLAGFTAPGAGEVLSEDDSFITDYFAATESWWQTFSSDVARNILAGLYPAWEISDEGLKAADDALTSETLTGSVRRVVAENRDRVSRALAAQRFDAK